jgi:hypothetical protein
MATQQPTPIRFPLSSFPGASTQESAGRVYNCYAETLDDGQVKSGPSAAVWRRSAGLSQLNNAATGMTQPYRGGLLVGNLAYEVFQNNVISIDASGNVTALGAAGTLTGNKKISIARDQAIPPHVVIVDPDNGAFANTGTTGSLFQPLTTYPSGFNQANSVAFQDGYFFLGNFAGQVLASNINSLTINSLAFITLQARSDVTGQRIIAFSGVLWCFTSGHCELWNDTAQPAPAFPYSRMLVLPYGLIQPAAIAGFETGFDTLIWVAQDFGVYQAAYGSFQPTKISPPDLDRFIENEVRNGNLLTAGCYIIQGKKFWTLTSDANPNVTGASPASRTWEFNLITGKWNERGSLLASIGSQSRWRGVGGHAAFGKWLLGDTQSSNMLYPDDTNYSDNGAPQLFRLESGPVDDFPNQIRIARADFDFVFGVGDAVKNAQMTVLNVTSGTATPAGTNLVRVTVNNTTQTFTNDQVNITGVHMASDSLTWPGGVNPTVNGTWMVNLIDAYNIELRGSTWVTQDPVSHAAFTDSYTSGGNVVALLQPPNVVTPQVAISISKDGGFNWGNPLLRSLGQQQRGKRVRASVKAMGLSGPMGNRWRLDITDAVYTAFLKATQASDPRYVGD